MSRFRDPRKMSKEEHDRRYDPGNIRKEIAVGLGLSPDASEEEVNAAFERQGADFRRKLGLPLDASDEEVDAAFERKEADIKRREADAKRELEEAQKQCMVWDVITSFGFADGELMANAIDALMLRMSPSPEGTPRIESPASGKSERAAHKSHLLKLAGTHGDPSPAKVLERRQLIHIAFDEGAL